MDDEPQVNMLIPLYNEEEVFPILIERLQKTIDASRLSIEAILVDDGSSDSTPLLMSKLALENKKFHAVFLSRNFGQQLALSAGLRFVNATEAVLILDGDLQDAPELLDEFYSHYQNGYDVVYAVRTRRKEKLLKRWSYKLFYNLLKKIAYLDIPLDSGDFSLISRKVVDHLNQMPEESRFLRGMRSWIGYRQVGVEYERQERQSGKSKYALKNLMKLAFNGIFNFSEYPIKLVFNLGLIALCSSLVYLGHTLVKKFVFGATPEGFTALLFTIIMFGGIQLVGLGLIGEYVLRIFFQVKGRPLYVVKERIHRQQRITGGAAPRVRAAPHAGG
jgi:glycosyltransferase involved in cell wall biosynthesis